MKRKLHHLFAAIALIMMAFPGSPALAVESGQKSLGGIAIIVNDDVISKSDLEKRLRLALAATGLPEAPESYARLRPQIIQALIDEKLQLQEAARNGIQVGKTDIEEGFAQIAQQNGMTTEQFRDDLQSKNINLKTLEDQIRAQIAWSQVVRRKLRPQVAISESDIDAEIEMVDSNANKPEYLVAEIFLAVPTPDKDESVQALAEQLIKQMVGGAPFGEIAKQFSQSAGAGNGGNLGWIRAGQLQPELDQVLGALEKGQISPPVRAPGGYHILFLRDRRISTGLSAAKKMQENTGPVLKRLVLPFAQDTNEVIIRALTSRAQRLAGSLTGCAAMDEEIEKSESALSGSVTEPQTLPADIQGALSGLAPEKASAPIPVPEGVAIFMNCGSMQTADAGAQPATAMPEQMRDNIANKLGLDRLDMLQRRYLNDLRATAYIDRRI